MLKRTCCSVQATGDFIHLRKVTEQKTQEEKKGRIKVAIGRTSGPMNNSFPTPESEPSFSAPPISNTGENQQQTTVKLTECKSAAAQI